jgi:hypothetical protein
MVPVVAAAVPKVDLDCAADDLDFKHYSHLLCLAFAHSWTAVVSSWLDYGAGIRICCSSRCHRLFAQDHTIGRTTMPGGPDGVKVIAPHLIPASTDPRTSSKAMFVSIH